MPENRPIGIDLGRKWKASSPRHKTIRTIP